MWDSIKLFDLLRVIYVLEPESEKKKNTAAESANAEFFSEIRLALQN